MTSGNTLRDPLQLMMKIIIFHMHVLLLQGSDKKNIGSLCIFYKCWSPLMAKAAVALQALRRTCLGHPLLCSLLGKSISFTHRVTVHQRFSFCFYGKLKFFHLAHK